MGALVTNNEAGDSVPDWPLAYGRMVPVTHLQGAVVYEYSHRVVAGTVGILTFVLALWAFVRERRAAVRVLAAAAVVAIVAQALLGGLRVHLGETHSYGVATIHAFTAQAFLCILTVLVVHLSPGWQTIRTATVAGGARQSLVVSWLAAAAVLLQALAGAGFRHRVFGVEPHVAGAVLVTALVLAAWIAARLAGFRSPDGSPARRAFVLSRLALVLVVVQIVLGPVTYFVMRSVPGVPTPGRLRRQPRRPSFLRCSISGWARRSS